MDARYQELKNRLVAVGTPSFSCSEFHELFDYICGLEKSQTTKSAEQILIEEGPKDLAAQIIQMKHMDSQVMAMVRERFDDLEVAANADNPTEHQIVLLQFATMALLGKLTYETARGF